MKNWVTLLLLILYSLILLRDFPVHDFTNLYFSGLFFAQGEFDEKTYDAYYFNRQIADLGYDHIFTGFYPNTPFAAIFFSAFTLLDLKTAKYVFIILSLVLLIFSLHRLFNYFNVPKPYLLLIPLLFFNAIKNNIVFGQAYILIFFFLAEGFLLFKKEKYFLSGLLWSLAILLKIFPVLILGYLIISRHWRSVFYITINCSVAVVVLMLISGFSFIEFYFNEVLLASLSGNLFNGFEPAAESSIMLLKNMFLYDQIANPDPWFDSVFAFHGTHILYKSLILACCTLVTLNQKAGPAIKFSIWLFAGLLFTPNLSSYAPIVLLIPVVALLGETKKIPVSYLFTFGITVFLFCNFPADRFDSMILQFSRLFLLLILFGFLLSKYGRVKQSGAILYLSIIWMMIITISALPSLGAALKHHPIAEEYLLPDDKHLLITGYGERDGRLYYHYWSENGELPETTDITIENLDSSDVYIADNQIYYHGAQVTFGSERKRLPMVADQKWIIYLSDKDRSLGFYTLRKIAVNRIEGE